MPNTKHVTIYTDGACLGNPGAGGYGAVILCEGQRKEISGGFRQTTNNRMELMGAIESLRALKAKCKVTLFSDSQYLVRAITEGWAKRWQANGWKRNKTEKALNPDLWEKLLTLCYHHEVEFKWIKGHASVTENERCDRLSMIAANRPYLPADEAYENSLK